MRLLVRRSLRAAATCLGLALVSWHCTATSTPASGSGSASIGPSGGSVTSADGAWEMIVPSGALGSAVTVTVTPSSMPGAIGTAYDIEPTGTTFATPVTMTFHYGAVDVGGITPDQIVPAVFAGGSWTALDGYSLDTGAETVSGTTTHLSPYGAVAGCGVGSSTCGSCSITCSGATPVPVCSQCPPSCTCAAGPADAGPTEAGGGSSGGGGQSCGEGAAGSCQGCQVTCDTGQNAVCTPGTVSMSGSGGSSCTPGTCTCEPGDGGSGSGGSSGSGSGSGGGSDGGMSGSSGGGSSSGSSSSSGSASSSGG